MSCAIERPQGGMRKAQAEAGAVELEEARVGVTSPATRCSCPWAHAASILWPDRRSASTLGVGHEEHDRACYCRMVSIAARSSAIRASSSARKAVSGP